jgi:hypothetical protein
VKENWKNMIIFLLIQCPDYPQLDDNELTNFEAKTMSFTILEEVGEVDVVLLKAEMKRFIFFIVYFYVYFLLI